MRPRLFSASASPWIAARRNHFTASASSRGTPRPLAYMRPRLFSASASPWIAARRNHFTASASSRGTPSLLVCMAPRLAADRGGADEQELPVAAAMRHATSAARVTAEADGIGAKMSLAVFPVLLIVPSLLSGEHEELWGSRRRALEFNVGVICCQPRMPALEQRPERTIERARAGLQQ